MTFNMVYSQDLNSFFLDKKNKKLKIAVIPFSINFIKHVSEEDVTDIIISDLNNSGKFEVLNRYNLPQYPNYVNGIIPYIWNNQNINLVIMGSIKEINNNDEEYNIYYQLINISNSKKKIIKKNSFKTKKKLLRYTIHKISDEIFERLTNIKGIFRTRLSYIAKYIKDNKNIYELRISDYDGHNEFTIRQSYYPLMSPSWSPDGSKIAYITFETGFSSLVLQTLHDGKIEKITSFPKHNGSPDFSLDGEKIVFVLSKTGSLNIYVINLITRIINSITNDKNNNTQPHWSENNIFYTSDRGGYSNIYKIDEDKGDYIYPERISWNKYSNQDSDVSQNGKIIVMVNINKNGQQNIFLQNNQKKIIKKLTHNFLDEHPRLSPNDEMIVYNTFISKKNKNSVIYLSSINTNSNICIKQNKTESFVFPSWSFYLN